MILFASQDGLVSTFNWFSPSQITGNFSFGDVPLSFGIDIESATSKQLPSALCDHLGNAGYNGRFAVPKGQGFVFSCSHWDYSFKVRILRYGY